MLLLPGIIREKMGRPRHGTPGRQHVSRIFGRGLLTPMPPRQVAGWVTARLLGGCFFQLERLRVTRSLWLTWAIGCHARATVPW